MSAGSTNYRNGIRSAVRGLWGGALDYYQFYEAMEAAIRSGLTTAWHEGAKACGILPVDLSPTERVALAQAIANEYNYITDFATTIEAGSKANGGKMGSLMVRAEVWINRYLDVVNRAKIAACADQKLEWVLNYIRVSKKHCGSCLKLARRVKRASVWEKYDIRPQSPRLECGGWRCACGLVVMDKPCTPGPLPNLP